MQFFAENPVPEGSMAIRQTLESIRTRAQWLVRDGAAIGEWLSRFAT